jgi:hypothetical protein
MPNFKFPRMIDGPQASTDVQDQQCIVTLSTSGASPNFNTLAIGNVVCTDITQLVGGTQATPLAEYVVPAQAAAAGMPFGVYQGANGTIANSSTTATATAEITVRKFGYGQVLVAGGTTNVLVGDNVTILPASKTPQACQKLVAAEGLTAGATTYLVATVVATVGAVSATSIVASSTAYTLVNAYINL